MEKAALGSRTDTPKGLIGLQLMLVCGGSLQKKERDEVCDGQAVTSTGGTKEQGDEQPVDRRSISTHTKEPGR